jgi:hypothetical protein
MHFCQSINFYSQSAIDDVDLLGTSILVVPSTLSLLRTISGLGDKIPPILQKVPASEYTNSGDR